MSALQYSAMKMFAGEPEGTIFPLTKAVDINQGTFNSLGRHEWIELVEEGTGKHKEVGFWITALGRTELAAFETADVFKKSHGSVFGSWWRGTYDSLADLNMSRSNEIEKEEPRVRKPQHRAHNVHMMKRRSRAAA
jgi:hypothetical protein